MTNPQPTIATNRENEGVAAAVNAHVAAVAKDRGSTPALAIATAYFNPGGFALMADHLESSPKVRLLLGAEPQPEPPPKRQLTDPVSPARAFKKALEAGLVTHDRRRSEILQPKWGNVKGRRRLRVWAIPVTRIWPIRGKDCRSTPELASRLARNHSQTEILESVKRRTQIKALNAQPKSLSTHSPRP